MMSVPSGGSNPVRLYRLAIRAFPKRLRDAYGAEMVATFSDSHAAFLSNSPSNARRYAWRASIDALTAGVRERFGRGGVGSPQPRTPLGNWTRRGKDALWREVGTDLRFAFRTLARSPVFTVTVLLVLALGVGINGAIFTAMNAALLAPMPYEDPDELVVLEYMVAFDARPGPPRGMGWSWPKYGVMAETAGLPIDAMAAYTTHSMTLAGRGDATRLQAEAITPGYFALLGIELDDGRPLSMVGDSSADSEVILSRGLWQERFGAEASVLGDDITLNGHPMTVVGVAPAGFRGLSGEAELWVSVPSIGTLISPVRLRPQVHWLQAIARLSDGASLAQLQERMQSVAASVDQAYPFDEPGVTVSGSATSMAEARRNPRAQRAVAVVAAAAGLVLLIACTNLAALLLARGSDRRREIAVRLALGGSRGRVARGMITETLLLAFGGGLLGVAVAAAAIRAVVRMWPATFSGGGWNLEFVDTAGFVLDAPTLAYTLGLGLAAGCLFGIGPALRLSRTDLAAALKEGTNSTARGGRWALGGRRLLVTAQIAVALVLLVAASLMIASLGRLLGVETGFDADRLLVFEYTLPRESVHAENPAAFHDDFFERLRSLPQVEAAAGGLAPLRGLHWSITRVTRAGNTTWGDSDARAIGIQTVTDDYFRTLRTPVVRGRTFDRSDQAGSPPVIVISESAVETFFPDVDPIGQPLVIQYGPTADGAPAEVIGVVADVLYDNRENGMMAEAYFLQRQNPEGDLNAMVRTRGEPFDVLPEVRAAMAAIDPDLPIFGITTAEELAATQVRDTRVIMQLLAAFAAIAVLLAATGIWGVVSYSVAQRRRELGIRMALGARTGQAVAMVLRHGMVSAVVGVGIGTLVAIGLMRYLGSLLYEVDSSNPTAFIAGAALLFAVALAAAWIPARQATNVDPAETLRSD